jgi:hypothetical protein
MNQYDSISVNLDNNRIGFCNIKRSLASKRNLESSISYTPQGNIGEYYQGITLECEKCCMFTYTIKLVMDLAHNKVTEISLNSETVSIEDRENIYEIKNIYAMNRLEYYHLNNENGEEKKDYLPILPIDMNNPLLTLKRIKKLLVFM